MRTTSAAAAAIVSVAVLGACADPGAEPPPDDGDAAVVDADPPADPTATATPTGEANDDEPVDIDATDAPDPRVDVLGAEVALVLASLEGAAGHVELWRSAAEADDLGGARAAAEATVHALTADPRLATDLDGDGTTVPAPTPLLPGPDASRTETVDYGDALSSAIPAARVTGDRGAALLAVLQDPIAGDLGVWQRDPAGPLDAAREAATAAAAQLGAGDAEAADRTVAALDGDALRALAWALVAASEPLDRTTTQAAGDRAAAHLAVCTTALAVLAG